VSKGGIKQVRKIKGMESGGRNNRRGSTCVSINEKGGEY